MEENPIASCDMNCSWCVNKYYIFKSHRDNSLYRACKFDEFIYENIIKKIMIIFEIQYKEI